MAVPVIQPEYGCGTTTASYEDQGLALPSDVFPQIYDVLRDVQIVNHTHYEQHKTNMAVLGKTGAVAPLEFDWNVFGSSDQLSSDGKPCLISTPASYLTDYPSILDHSYAFGITVVQGVGAAKKAHTLARVPAIGWPEYTFSVSNKEWIREGRTAGGYPAALGLDDNTIPIGWA